jgi:membrane protein
MLTLVLHVFGTTILDYLNMTTVPVLLFLMDVIDLRVVLLLVLQTALFSTMYAALPSQRLNPLRCVPGALFASLGWLTFSDLFAMYVVYFPNYANIFGSVYAVALAMLWLYCCINIVFYGAVINRIAERWQKRKD